MAAAHYHTLFSVAHTDIRGFPRGNHERTLRVVVRSNLEALGVSVLFSNEFGDTPLPIGAATLAVCDSAGDLIPDTLVPLTVGGRLAFELPPGGELKSDEAAFPLCPGDTFALSLYYPTNERVVSGNWVGGDAYLSGAGNFTTDLKLPGKGLLSRLARTLMDSDLTVALTSVKQVIARCAAPHRTVGCFGDSITQQGNWTTPFQKRLYWKYPGEISVCNLGISGNQLLGPSPPAVGGLNGPAGFERFDTDLMEIRGLTHAILAIGTNDIGLPGSNGLPPLPIITLEQYAAAMATLAGKLRAAGVKAYVATITPRGLGRPPYDENRERLRLAFNDWIRGADCFDAVLDFDAVMRRPDGLPGVRDNYFLPDELHPSPYGGMRVAKAIDLALFSGGAS